MKSTARRPRSKQKLIQFSLGIFWQMSLVLDLLTWPSTRIGGEGKEARLWLSANASACDARRSIENCFYFTFRTEMTVKVFPDKRPTDVASEVFAGGRMVRGVECEGVGRGSRTY